MVRLACVDHDRKRTRHEKSFNYESSRLFDREPSRPNPGTIKAWDHSSGHARATDHQRHPLPSPSGTHGATARRNKTPDACPEFQSLSAFPEDHPVPADIVQRLRSSRASRRPEALHAPRPLSLFCGVVKWLFCWFCFDCEIQAFLILKEDRAAEVLFVKMERMQ